MGEEGVGGGGNGITVKSVSEKTWTEFRQSCCCCSGISAALLLSGALDALYLATL